MYTYSDATMYQTEQDMPFDGKRITRLRQKRGWKESDLAKAIGSTQQTISRYETGSRQPPADILTKLADALETSTDFLCGKTKNSDPLIASQLRTPIEYFVIELFRTGKLDLDKLTMLDKFRDLTESRQKAIIRQLRGQGSVLNKRGS